MNRPYLLMSGEPTVTTTLAFSNSKWDHLSVPTKLVQSEYSNKNLRRENRPREILSGIIHYADVSDKSIEIHNLSIIKEKNISCWPDSGNLLKMTDRHVVMNECVKYGLVGHDVYQSKFESIKEVINIIKYPFVIKTGTEHRGIGKYLVLNDNDIPQKWDGVATIEPYFEGDSVRVLFIGSNVFIFKTTNSQSWIKNSPGADIEKCTVSDEVINHAKNVSSHFKLDISGVDYIIDKNGDFHFLEINQYPGLGVFEDVERCGREFIKKQMYNIENIKN